MQFTTNLVRFSYVNVFKPVSVNNGPERYSVTCLLPKADTAGYNALMAAVNSVKESEKDGKFKGLNMEYVKFPIHDGDGVNKDGKPFGDECKGHWVFTVGCSADRPPQILDAKVQPIMNQADVYSGAYGHVAMSIFAYDNNSKGIGFGLNAIMKKKDGEPLGFSFNAQDAFGAFAQASSGGGEIDPLTGLPMDENLPF